MNGSREFVARHKRGGIGYNRNLVLSLFREACNSMHGFVVVVALLFFALIVVFGAVFFEPRVES